MELYIDNNAVELDPTARIAVSLSVRAIADPEKARAGYTRTIRIPMTPRNDATMGFAGEILSAERFNATLHTGRIECEGVTLMEGPLYLTRTVGPACGSGGVSGSDAGGFYEIHIIGAAKEWASAAVATPLRETPIAYSKTLSASTIEASWGNSDPVKFLPVARTSHVADHSAGGVIPAVKILTTDDYHPFINVRELLTAIFAQSGWAVESEFLDSDEFRSLYMSGNYPTRNVQSLKDAMDFLARRLRDSSAVANSAGRVYADPYRASYTVGNLVDSASAQESSSAGSAFTDQFSRGGCFQMDDNRVAFIPTREVTAGFQYHLRYTTDVRILTRSKMAGFDEIYLSEQFSRRFVLANPYPDRRGSFRAGRTYQLAVFEHVTGRQYQLRYSVRTVSGGASAAASSAVVGSRFSSIAVASAAEALDPQLWYRDSRTGTWSLYNADWALYDGFVTETGTLDVELTVRTASETITPARPKFFDAIYFGGAEPGMRLTVSEKTWVKPVFYAQPGEGATLSFAEICAHGASQMDLIAAIRQMYNLQFYTDPRARTVKIEPIRTFYIDKNPTDWTSRIDTSKPIEVAEMGGELAREMVWSYRSGDEAVSRFNRRNGGQMGRWSVKVESAAAADTVRVWENALFTPSISTTGAYGGAPSARLIGAGSGAAANGGSGAAGSGSGGASGAAGSGSGAADTGSDTSSGAAGSGDASGAAGSNAATGSDTGMGAVEAATEAIVEGTEDLNFLPKIVRYEGLKPLPDGENWGWPATPNSSGSASSSGAQSYPKLAFHAPESGYTLCHEDRDGCTGLHVNRDDDVRLWNNSRRVTVWLDLAPTEIETLCYPTGYGVDFRSTIALVIGGERALYRLEEVTDYDPAAASTKCVLIKHLP